MKNISSMNLNFTSGLHLALPKTSSSKLAKKILAKYLDALNMSTMKETQATSAATLHLK